MKILAISKKRRPLILDCLKDVENPPQFTGISLTRRAHLNILASNSYKPPKQILEAAMKSQNKENLQEQEKSILDVMDTIDLSEINKMSLNNIDIAIKIMEEGKVEWTNLIDDEGEVVESAVENYELLSDEVRTEIVKQLIGVISEAEAKNSEAPLSSASGEEMKGEGTDTIAEPVSTKSSRKNATVPA